MARIVIAGVSYDQVDYHVLVTLVEAHPFEGEDVDVPLGEAAVRIPGGMEIADIKKVIVKEAEKIMDAHRNALDRRKDIEEIDFPDIP